MAVRRGWNFSPWVAPALITPKMDGSWHIHNNSHAINKITIKYMFSIHKLDNMLDWQILQPLLKVYLKNRYCQLRMRSRDMSG